MLIQQIINKIAIRDSDATVKDESMAGKQIITTIDNEKVNEGEIASASWKYNTILAAEVLILLNLTYLVYKTAKHVSSGFMQVYHDNLKIVQEINKPFQKTSDGLTDGSYSVNKIRRLLKKLKFKVAINH